MCAPAVPNENTVYLTNVEELEKIIESDHLTEVKIQYCDNCSNIVHTLNIENTNRYGENPILFESFKYLEHHSVFIIDSNSIKRYLLDPVTKKKEIKKITITITMEEFISVIKEADTVYTKCDFVDLINQQMKQYYLKKTKNGDSYTYSTCTIKQYPTTKSVMRVK